MHINNYMFNLIYKKPPQKTDFFSSCKRFFFFFSPEMPVNDDPGDTQEQQHTPAPVRAPDAYNHHRALLYTEQILYRLFDLLVCFL